MKRHDEQNRTLSVWLTVWLAAGAFALAGGPVLGDVLVTRDGSQVETRGPWTVKDRLVVFTRPDGTLVSMRLSELDLEASEQATANAKAGEKAAAEKASAERETADRDRGTLRRDEPRARAAWVLTDADFSRRRIPYEADAESAAEATEQPAGASTQAAAPPVVLAYERETDPQDQHVIVSGTLANQTRTTAAAISLEVSLYNEQTELIQMRRAVIEKTTLAPGAETTFRAEFPDVFGFSAVQFRPRSTNLATGEGPAPRVPSAEGAAEEEAAGAGGGVGDR